MINTRLLATNLVHVLKDRVLIRSGLKGHPLIEISGQTELSDLNNKLIYLVRLDYVTPRLEQVLEDQENLVLSGKGFHLSKNHISSIAIEKDLRRALELQESFNLRDHHVRTLASIVKLLKEILNNIKRFEFSFKSLEDLKAEKEKVFKEMIKVLKKANEGVILK